MANQAQVMYHDSFNGHGFTNENSLANALLTKPDTITPVITHLAGRESDKFPLTFLTEGQAGGVRPIELNDVQYDWGVMGRMKHTDKLVSTIYGAGDKPGLNSTPFYIVFETNWLKRQHTIISPNGVQCRIQGQPNPVGAHYEYKLQLINPDASAFCPLSELAAGTAWSMTGGASVSESFSMGNESNTMAPGKLKNQISILRKSYHWGGNIKNKTVEVEFNIDGKKTNLWMPFEEWQHMMEWKQSNEEHFWWSQYNRRADGSIPLIDEDSNLPIPIGAGVDQQIPNRDTYSILTHKKLKQTVGDVMYGATDTGKMNVILYTGMGGADEFDEAIKDKASGFTQIIGDKFTTGTGRNLRLTGFYTSFEHVDGHVVTLAKLPLLDFGSRAENSPKHPVTGRPMSSYEMYFVDQSMYDGEQNVRMVTQKGRSMIRKCVAGMSEPGMDFNGNNQYIATEQDKSSVHFLAAKGICIRRANHCFKLSCNLS
jgi:hypothetical protein